MLRASDPGPDAPKARGDFLDGPALGAELTGAVLAAVDRHVAIACADEAGRITFANHAFCQLSGYAREELLGQDHRLLDSGHHPRELLAEVCRRVERGDTWTGELKHRAKSGAEYWVAATVAPIGAGAHPGSHYVAICTDITRAKRHALQEVEQHQEQLRQSDEQYAYAASHDLQEPVRAVVGCGQLLEQEFSAGLDPTLNQLIGHMIEGGKRMQRLVQDLLEYARVGTHRPRLVSVSSQDALTQALGQLEALVRESAAEIDTGVLPTVLCDPQQLVDVFRELLRNALTYRGSARPLIRVRADLEGAFWTFCVADNGIGIDPESHRRVFLLFQRLHPRHELPSRGIGLSVCKKIVERHGGRLWVESERGQGATFLFTLPARLTPPLDQFE